jgi:hypothetical protein
LRSKRGTQFTANPFVAFADIAIAIAFIFALCSIALSKSLSDLDRDMRQTKVQIGFDELIKSQWPNVTTKFAKGTKTKYSQERNLEYYSDGLPVAKLLSNGSYQRLELSQEFRFGQKYPKSEDRYKQLGKILAEVMSNGDIDYIFLHAITEPGETPNNDKNASIKMAQERSESIFTIWEKYGLMPNKNSNSIDLNGKLNPEYIVQYGKDGLYRKNPDALQMTSPPPGRVDIVLFFADKASSKEN